MPERLMLVLCWLVGHRWIVSYDSGKPIVFGHLRHPVVCCGRCGATEPFAASRSTSRRRRDTPEKRPSSERGGECGESVTAEPARDVAALEHYYNEARRLSNVVEDFAVKLRAVREDTALLDSLDTMVTGGDVELSVWKHRLVEGGATSITKRAAVSVAGATFPWKPTVREAIRAAVESNGRTGGLPHSSGSKENG